MKILVVDDSQAMREIVKWNLSHTDFGHDKILEASCGQDALEIIEIQKPDLVITDWNMPEMAGLQLLRTLREAHNSVKFGFVLTQSSENVRTIAKDSGADFIISNPSSVHSFKTQINQPL